MNLYSMEPTEYNVFALQESLETDGSLRDFDWKVRCVFGSSKIAARGAPILSLNLHCNEIENSGKENAGTNSQFITTRKTISMEMNKQELKSLLATLEKIEEHVNLGLQGER